MRKIIQYMMMALIAVVLASCANDISEESTPTGKSNIRFVVDDFPMFEKPSTRTIGEEDKGKTAWAVGDEICVKLESKELGIQTATLKYNGVKFEIQDGNSLCYLEGEPVTASAWYAPNRRWRNGSLEFKDVYGNSNGTAEFLEATCTVHYGDNNYVDISFADATRKYSRLRIATMPNMPITVDIDRYTPAGSSDMKWDQNYALTSDEKGNAYLYGTFENNSEVTVKYREAALTTHTFSQATESAKSYALDATVISANSAEEIKSAIEQKVADGKTAIRLNLASDAGTDEFNAIREAFEKVKSGTIDLTLIGCKEIPANGLNNQSGGLEALKSITLPDVTKIGKYALYFCVDLEEICAPNVSAIDEGAFAECRKLRKVTLGELTDVKGDYEHGGGIFGYDSSIENIDLYLPKNQEVMEFDENQYIWKPTGESYFASLDYDNGIFLGYQFNSVKSWE